MRLPCLFLKLKWDIDQRDRQLILFFLRCRIVHAFLHDIPKYSDLKLRFLTSLFRPLPFYKNPVRFWNQATVFPSWWL